MTLQLILTALRTGRRQRAVLRLYSPATLFCSLIIVALTLKSPHSAVTDVRSNVAVRPQKTSAMRHAGASDLSAVGVVDRRHILEVVAGNVNTPASLSLSDDGGSASLSSRSATELLTVTSDPDWVTTSRVVSHSICISPSLTTVSTTSGFE